MISRQIIQQLSQAINRKTIVKLATSTHRKHLLKSLATLIQIMYWDEDIINQQVMLIFNKLILSLGVYQHFDDPTVFLDSL